MERRILVAVLLSAFAFSACEKADSPRPAGPESAVQPAPAREGASFVNRVWVAVESKQVQPGELRVFLSDGTLVMASPHSKPAFGQWRSEGGQLTITEEGRNYPTEILALGEDAFRIRINGPGEPVEILFAPAPQVDPEAATSAEPAVAAEPAATAATAATVTAAAPPEPVSLLGTAWRLESLGNGKLQAGTQPSLEFPTEGRAGGNGSCNRFNGIVIVAGDAIKFSGLATTRKACAEAVMKQEESYLAALRDAVRFEADTESLRLYSAGREEPLRFAAAAAPVAAPAPGIQSAPAVETPTMTGIWTVVGHSIPGTAAMNDEQAKARHGQSLRLTRATAASDGQRCDAPRYAVRAEPTEEFLAGEYKLAPASLKLVARRSQVRVMQVTCGGSSWNALGATLIEVDRDRALAPWNGVFFELARDRDFRAVGQEPGWQLELRIGSEMRLTYDYGKNSAVTPAARAQVDARTGTRSFHAVTEANDLRVEIVPVTCQDSMSGKSFPATVTVTLNDRSYRGCGESLATPFQ